MFYIGIKQVDWLLWHHRGLLIKHNVPVYMSTHTSVIVSCRIHLCFLSSPPLSFALSLSLFQPVNVTESAPRRSPCASTSSPPPPPPPPSPQRWQDPAFSPFPASLLSLPCSHHSCSQAPSSLAATVFPSPSLRAPLWVLGSAASASPAVRSLALPLLCSPSQTQYSLPFGLRGGEGKHFKLQIYPGKQDGTDSSELILTGCENLNVRWHLSICFFTAETHLSSPSLLSPVVSLASLDSL